MNMQISYKGSIQFFLYIIIYMYMGMAREYANLLQSALYTTTMSRILELEKFKFSVTTWLAA